MDYHFLKPSKSLETLDRHNQTHNDIKPQNFLVKFKNGQTDLTRIDIVLTDFGMADSDSKGGTPVFASPECFEKKEKKSDIFSFGRVILFLLLTKNQFAKWLFVPLKNQSNVSLVRNLILHGRYHNLRKRKKPNIVPNQRMVTCSYLVSKMTSLVNRMGLQPARDIFDGLRRFSQIKLTNDLITAIDTIVNNELSTEFSDYVSELCDHR